MKSFKKVLVSTLLASSILGQVGLAAYVQASESASEEVVSEETVTSEVSSEDGASSVADETLAANEARANDPAKTDKAITEKDGVERDDSGKVISVTIGGEKAEVTAEMPTTKPAPTDNKPNRISLNVTEEPSTSMAFQWHTTAEDKEARLYVWEEGKTIEEATEFTPEISKIEDACYIQQTEAGNFVYAIMWDDEKDEPLTELDEPTQVLTEKDKVKGYFTDAAFTKDNLKWIDKGYEDYAIAVPYEQFTETAYKAIAKDLKPATVYHFAVGNKAGELSEEGTFTTAAADAQDFTFVHYTDTQNAVSSENQRSEVAYTLSTLESVLANSEAAKATMAVHTGDVVNDDWNDSEWRLTLDAIQTLNMKMPHLFVTGNHDDKNFQIHLNTPNEIEGMKSGSAYSTRYNGVQFITLNTQNAKESEEENPSMISEDQMKWFEEELKAAKDAKEKGEISWIVVNYHKPLFSSSYHALQDKDVQMAREGLMNVIDQYDVDMVLNGHDHNLTVTQALAFDKEAFGKAKVVGEAKTEGDTTTYDKPEGTVFFVPNTAGTKTYDAIYKNQSFEWVLENEKIAKTYEELFQYEVKKEDIDAFRKFFVTEDQPFRSSFYAEGHSNARESNIQHYAIVDVTADSLTYKLFQVIGEDLANRETNLVHTYVIKK